MPQVPFAFEFEYEGPNGTSMTKQLPNYHSAIQEKLVEWPNGNSVTVCYSVDPNSKDISKIHREMWQEKVDGM